MTSDAKGERESCATPEVAGNRSAGRAVDLLSVALALFPWILFIWMASRSAVPPGAPGGAVALAAVTTICLVALLLIRAATTRSASLAGWASLSTNVLFWIAAFAGAFRGCSS
jgi:hypothetical protein